jgi:hypothetical protein
MKNNSSILINDQRDENDKEPPVILSRKLSRNFNSQPMHQQRYAHRTMQDSGREQQPKRIVLRAIPKHISIEDLNGKEHIEVAQKTTESNPILNVDFGS